METVPNTFPALFQAYSIVWGLLVVYIVSIGVRLRRIEKRLEGRCNEPASRPQA
ncbi:MAG: hypothetical protein RL417_1886 [Pseudomonadota bacterium]|jgi:CcmD family protein